MIVTKYPFLMSFAGNPMRYLLTSGSGGGGGEEVLSIIEIGFTDIDVTEDHSMEVTVLGAPRTFSLKNSPATKDHLPTADGAWTPAQWAQACFDFIINDVQLTDAYKIEIDTDTITLTAKVGAPLYDMTMGATTIVGAEVHTIQGGVAGTSGTVEGVLMRVLKDGTELLGEDYKSLDASGNVKFEIQEYINATLLQIPPPRFSLTAATYFRNVYTDYFLKYRTTFCNRVAGVYEPRTYTDPVNAYCYAIAGGLNREDLVTNNLTSVDYFNLADTQKKFLTWSPPSKLTDKAETHSLFFAFQNPAYTSFKLKAHIYNRESGNTISITPFLLVQRWSVVEFLAGYTQLGLSAHLSGAVDRWELFLVDQDNNLISDIREFVLDAKYYENTRYFRFRNSWGTYDSLRCTGVFETIVEHDREKVNFMSDEVETSFNTPGAYTMIKEAQSFKANTGWLTRDFLNYLRDFMLSTDIFEVEASKLHHCLLTTKKTSLFKDKDYNYSLAFEYERAYDDFFFQGLE